MTEETTDDEPKNKVVLPPCGILCGIIGIPIVGILACIKNPAACLAITGGGGGSGGGGGDKPPGDDDKPPKDRPPTPHACVFSINLPSGELVAIRRSPFPGRYFLTRSFPMRITFLDQPEIGCFPNMGEYHQELRGFAERDGGTGTMQAVQVDLVGGPLHPTTWREDAREGNGDLPYGHRYWDDALEIAPRPNQDEDSFLDDREHGTRYHGVDEPGMETTIENERMRFRFEFHGGPVERFQGVRRRLGGWRTWVVRGDYAPPPPPIPPLPPTPSQPPPSQPPPPTQTTPSPADKVYDARVQPTSPTIGRGGHASGRARTPREREG